jgi:hypothetical protein
VAGNDRIAKTMIRRLLIIAWRILNASLLIVGFRSPWVTNEDSRETGVTLFQAGFHVERWLAVDPLRGLVFIGMCLTGAYLVLNLIAVHRRLLGGAIMWFLAGAIGGLLTIGFYLGPIVAIGEGFLLTLAALISSCFLEAADLRAVSQM